jgi:hypothetical protein
MTKDDLKNLHPADVTLWLHVEAAVWRLVEAANLPVDYVRPTPLNEVDCGDGMTLYGQCRYYRRGRRGLVFTLRRRIDGQWRRQRMPMHALLDTIAHECAHAKVKWADDHGANFFRAFARMMLLSEKLRLRVDIEKAGVILPP